MLGRWWTAKYKLPIDDSRFQNQASVELYAEFCCDLMIERKELADLLEEGPASIQAAEPVRKRIKAIDDVVAGETQVDDWEAALERGQRPAVGPPPRPGQTRIRPVD